MAEPETGDRGTGGEPAAAISHLKQALAGGAPWAHALLEAVSLWTLPEEHYLGHHYRYLLLGEAFDWLVLAERLLAEVDGAVPAEEKEKLLFSGRLPETVSTAMFRRLLGPEKYRAHLNYFYGVMVEESLLLAEEEAVRKQRLGRGLQDTDDVAGEAYPGLYSADRDALLRGFCQQTHRPVPRSLSVTDLKEFTYWLFKRRLASSDQAKVASDTRRGLERLLQLSR